MCVPWLCVQQLCVLRLSVPWLCAHRRVSHGCVSHDCVSYRCVSHSCVSHGTNDTRVAPRASLSVTCAVSHHHVGLVKWLQSLFLFFSPHIFSWLCVWDVCKVPGEFVLWFGAQTKTDEAKIQLNLQSLGVLAHTTPGQGL